MPHPSQEVLCIVLTTHNVHNGLPPAQSCSDRPLRLTHCALQVRDDYGKEVGSQVCHIVGADGGVVPRPIALPSGGLMTDVAYRW